MRRGWTVLLLFIVVSVTFWPPEARAFSYGTAVHPGGTTEVPDPTVWFSFDPSGDPGLPSVTLTLNGQSYPMTYNGSQGIFAYTLTSPIPPGQTETGTVVITEAFYQTVSLPVSFQEGAVPLTPLPESLGSWKVLTLLNRMRATLGLSPLAYDANLAAASQAHATYVSTNYQALYASGSLSMHEETSSFPAGFTGQWPWDRDEALGAIYPSSDEVMTENVGGPGTSLLALLDTTFHRFGLLDPTVTDMGTGVTLAPQVPIFVADMGGPATSPTPVTTVVLFPWNGATGVRTSFTGEDPNPLSAYRSNSELAQNPAGYPVTVTFQDPTVTGVQVASATLSGPAGPVPIWELDGTNYQDTNPVYSGESMGNSVALFAQSALLPDTSYTATVTGTLTHQGGTQGPFTETWSFTTSPAPTLSRAFAFGKTVYVMGSNLLEGSGGVVYWYSGHSPGTPAEMDSESLTVFTFSGPPDVTGVGLSSSSHPTVSLSVPPFKDFSLAPWAVSYIAQAQSSGIVTGEGGGIFAPNDPVTGEQALTMIYRSLGSPATAVNPSAASVPAWAQAAVSWAIQASLISSSGVSSLGGPADRADLSRWLLVAESVAPLGTVPTFTDTASIPAADVGYVSAAQSLGLITGFPNGSFGPLQSVTRAQMAKLLDLLSIPTGL